MCDYPRLAWRVGIDSDTGKQRIRFINRPMSFQSAKEKFGDALLLIPCGKCPSCTANYSRTWSVRLMLESLYHDSSLFLTLTYANAPDKISKRDVQLFLKRLRKQFPDNNIRYFACGEYGSEKNTHRPHYHIILFGVDFADKEFIFSNKLGQKFYRSRVLDRLWSHGLASFSDVTPSSCAYTARYSMKKKLSMSNDDYFLLMSTHPGLGMQFFLDKKDILYLSDKVYSGDFTGVSIPRYFDKLAERDPIVNDIYLKCKESRIKRAKDKFYNNMIMNNCSSVEEMNLLQLEKSVRRMKTLRRS